MCKIVTNGYNAGATLLANSFIDNYMAECNGTQLKVYLYLLRHCQEEISVSMLASSLDITNNTVIKALKHWNDLGLIDYSLGEDSELKSLVIRDANSVLLDATKTMDKEASEVSEDEAVAPAKKAVKKETKELKLAKKESEVKTDASKTDASQANEEVVSILASGSIPNWMSVEGWDQLFEDEIFREKLTGSDQENLDSLAFVLNHPITPSEIDFVAFLYNKEHGCGFDSDLIVYLFSHCYELINKSYGESSAYYKRVALSWYEEGYRNIADYLIPAMESHLGVPVSGVAQTTRAVGWVTKNKISINVILDACDRACMVDKDRFKTLCGKIKHYIEAHITTMDQVKERDKRLSEASSTAFIKQSTNTFNNFDQRKTSKEEDIALEKKLTNRGVSKEKLDIFEERLKEAANAAKKKPAAL